MRNYKLKLVLGCLVYRIKKYRFLRRLQKSQKARIEARKKVMRQIAIEANWKPYNIDDLRNPKS